MSANHARSDGTSALARLAARLARQTESLVPDAFSIACLLTFATLFLAVVWGGATPALAIRAWGGGVFSLLPLSMQIALVVFAGYLLAVSPPAMAVLSFIARIPKTPRQAVGFAAFASMVICWLNWGVGLVASAILIRALKERHPLADYRLLVAAGYLGMGTTWHGGPSGTVPLLFSSADSFMIRDRLISAPVALSETIFSASNLGLMIASIGVLTILAVVLQSHRVETVAAAAAPRSAAETETASQALPQPVAGGLNGFAASISQSRALVVALGVLGFAFVFGEVHAARFSLSLDAVNLIVLSLAFLAYRSPAALLRSVEDAAKPLHGVVLQFPLYAGIYGIIRDTGLAERLAQLFLSAATPKTLPLVVFAYSAVLNYWVPSGGAKWAMEAPYLLKASGALGVSPASIAMAYSYGDMATNLIQPFWAIPLLGVAKLEFKDILGFELIFFAVFSALATATLLLS